MKVEKSNGQIFGSVRCCETPTRRKYLRKEGIKATLGLTYDNRFVLYAFPHISRELELANLLHGEVISDQIAKAHIRNKYKNAIFGPFLSLIKRITNKA